MLDGQTVSLTAQEFELLHYLAKHAGLLVTRALLQDVWGYQSQTDTSRTVDYHIRSLRKKLGMTRPTRASSRRFTAAATG